MKKFILSRKIYVIFGIAVLALTMSGCGVVPNQAVQQQTTSSVQSFSSSILPVVISPTTPTPTPAVKGWKVYVDKDHHFSFEYPPSLELEARNGPNDFLLDNKNGQHIVEISFGSTPIYRSLDETAKMWSRYDSENYKVNDSLVEKISDTTTTIGYLSRWKFQRLGTGYPSGTRMSGVENAANFLSKLDVATPRSDGAEDKFIVLFQTYEVSNWSQITPALFRHIVSTFQFTQ